MSATLAPNLARRSDDAAPGERLAAHDWFSLARFGLFIHYGLYSLHGKGEWHMDRVQMPRETYNGLADDFRAEEFDADAIAALARRSGAGYIVLGARHHEGFCLFDTQTTDFNSLRAPCGRDLIREYVDACRGAGLRVGIYYSVMSWQRPELYRGPSADPRGWAAMVEETHEQVRELMTRYGRIDLLWYDGCIVPGVSDPLLLAHHWRSRELNAMVRRLQPDILINDRAALPGDFSTPEQRLTLPPRGRRWEMCLTLNDHWGWFSGDNNLKSRETLLRLLVRCAAHDGNLLLNIGPEPDGSLPPEQAERFEAVGRWMAANGEALRGTHRTPYTEAENPYGMVTARGRRLYIHLFDPPEGAVRVAGLSEPPARARLLATGDALALETFADGTATVGGLPPGVPGEGPDVIALDFPREAPSVRPPEPLVERDTGLFDPPQAPVHAMGGAPPAACFEWTVDAPADGSYRLDLGVLPPRHPLPLTLRINGEPVATVPQTVCADYPQTLSIGPLALARGAHRLLLSCAGEIPFRLTGWRLRPLWRPLRPDQWTTVGPFPTAYRIPGREEDVRAAMRTVFPPETEFRQEALYPGAGGKPVGWRREPFSGPTVDFSRIHGGENGVCYARTVIRCPRRRTAMVLIGCDWWADLFVNGRRVRSHRNPGDAERDGAWFNAWKPIPAEIPLEEGENVLLLKCHPGRAGNWFSFHLNEAPGEPG